MLGRLIELNYRAEGYAEMRLGNEIGSLTDFREKNFVKFAIVVSFLKVYYVFSAPVVTIVSRNDWLMSLAGLVYAPTRRVAKKILG